MNFFHKLPNCMIFTLRNIFENNINDNFFFFPSDDSVSFVPEQSRSNFYDDILEFVHKYKYFVIIVASGASILLVILPLILIFHRMCRKKLVVYRPTPTQVLSCYVLISMI